jgi:hypothetical protein
MMKPPGMLAHEDTRHRHERGTALRVEAEHLVASPEIEVSGPAVYSWYELATVQLQSRTYLALVNGCPESTICTLGLRPKQGQPKEDAETAVDVLWQGQECSLVSAKVHGCERASQVRKHLHLLGFSVWGDRRFGNTRANMRARGVYGLAKPWCHLSCLEVYGSPGIRCECALPRDLLKVLQAVGCPLNMPRRSKVVRFAQLDPPNSDATDHGLASFGLHHYEQRLAIQLYRELASTHNGGPMILPWSVY